MVERERRYVELQVRTYLQDQWAQIVERLGDRWGRQIRYGGGPAEPDKKVAGSPVTRAQVWEAVLSISNQIEQVEVAEVEAGSERGSDELATLKRNLEETMSVLHKSAASGRL